MTLSRGRDLTVMPGPSIMPDRVLGAMHRAAPSIYEGEMVGVTHSLIRDLKRIARTDGAVAMYIGNGHAGWEAALANLLAPGDRALVLGTGRFALAWGEMARQMGIDVEVLDFGFRAPVDRARLAVRASQARSSHRRSVLRLRIRHR
jgi:alanine-glyoxylate transaminase/serine-glyoxylate transaminase/serine-pyruvate transaminase